jgi:hypothetical protein
MLTLVRAPSLLVLALLWALILGGVGFAQLLSPVHGFALWCALLYLGYLGYPLIVGFALTRSSTRWLRRRLIGLIALGGVFAFIPVASPYAVSGDPAPTWFSLLSLVFGVCFFYVMWFGTAAFLGTQRIVSSSQPLGRLATFVSFFLLPWGGVLILHPRVQRLVAQAAA